MGRDQRVPPVAQGSGKTDMSVRARTIAFFLPQFHTIPENDRWWGPGFTEWTNVRRARPAFSGHDHPRRAGPLGEYDLRDESVLHAQAALAVESGIDAFCIYYYWFSGKRLLEAPLDLYLKSGPDFPFCISWANENWSRRWDGKDHQVLISQEYDEGTAAEVFRDMLKYLSDPRYLRVDSRAVLVVHRVDHIPHAAKLAIAWRRIAREAGIGELYLIAAETRRHIDPRPVGFDAVAEFPPVGANTLGSALLRPPPRLDAKFRGRLMSYERTARRFMSRRPAEFRRHPGVMPGWDNSARRGPNATVYVDASPQRYSQWLAHARDAENRHGKDGLVFINAWNEWAEGAYLEPDASHGDEYLSATRPDYAWRAIPSKRPVGMPSVAWLRSTALAAAASALNAGRWLSERLRTSIDK
ncbi:glycoside hydrolase family 99-like domain-containing protein [Microbacterium sp. SS28]|uniref:glycosyltransferase WbsX family protein n=1 Tax=Microbacterium sp. SS28 TaxID=2919948 RepID=UPI001FAACDEF|nr:glycoside hydrolase family 99-like domain-containing protein [Microbacterium sp. SS28]